MNDELSGKFTSLDDTYPRNFGMPIPSITSFVHKRTTSLHYRSQQARSFRPKCGLNCHTGHENVIPFGSDPSASKTELLFCRALFLPDTIQVHHNDYLCLCPVPGLNEAGKKYPQQPTQDRCRTKASLTDLQLALYCVTSVCRKARFRPSASNPDIIKFTRVGRRLV